MTAASVLRRQLCAVAVLARRERRWLLYGDSSIRLLKIVKTYQKLPNIYMKNFSQTHALQAVDLNSISNLYLVSLQPYVFRAEYGICNYGTKQ